MTKIGFVAGSFDLIHPGYIELFQKAKDKCDYLVVGLHNDPTIERKEKIKPILTILERIKILESIKYIDLIKVYNTEKDLVNLLREISPDIRFLGEDYVDKEYTGKNIAKEVIFLDRSHGWSTTKFKEIIYNNFKEWRNTNE